MRLLRVYDRDRLVREVRDVAMTHIPDSGALVCEMFGGNLPGCLARLVFAPRTWTHVEEWNGDAPEIAAEASAAEPEPIEQATAPEAVSEATSALPVIPASDAQRVHEAMAVLCICAELRCPVIINASTREERRWWQIRQHGTGAVTGAPPEPQPLMQCVHDLGHDTDVTHEWWEGGWPFGPANHHRACPRHPDAYNLGEGQPRDAAGVTPSDVFPPEATEQTDRTLIRPYVTGDVSGYAHGSRLLNGQGMDYSRDMSVVVDDKPDEHDRRPVNQAARTAWGVCAQYAPGYPERNVWCALPYGHVPRKQHEQTLPGGDRVSW